MADEASVNCRGTGRVPGSSSAEFDGVAEFVDEIGSLAELQAKAFAARTSNSCSTWEGDKRS